MTQTTGVNKDITQAPSVSIDCPEHITHKATLFTNGHKYQGIWECPEGFSDTCPHFDVKVELDTDDDGNRINTYICVKCGVVAEFTMNEESDE